MIRNGTVEVAGGEKEDGRFSCVGLCVSLLHTTIHTLDPTVRNRLSSEIRPLPCRTMIDVLGSCRGLYHMKLVVFPFVLVSGTLGNGKFSSCTSLLIRSMQLII